MQTTRTRTGQFIVVGSIDGREGGPMGPFTSEARADEAAEMFTQERAHLMHDHDVHAVTYELVRDEAGGLWRA